MRLGFLSWVVLILIAGGAAPAFAQDAQSRLLKSPGTSAGKKVLPLVLVEADRQPEVLASLKTVVPGSSEMLLPNRVYWYHSDEDDKWYYVQTNLEGKYPTDPYEYVCVGTILEGKLLGAKHGEQPYMMNAQRIWVPTFKKGRQTYWLEDKIGRLKMVDYGQIVETPAETTKGGK